MKSTVNSRLFKWSLILNALKDKVTIVHWPGRIHTNVDPLSRYPASYSINLLHMKSSWENRLRRGYVNDRTFRKILQRLMSKFADMEEGKVDSKKGPGDKGAPEGDQKEKGINEDIQEEKYGDEGERVDDTTGPGDKGAPKEKKKKAKERSDGAEKPGDRGGQRRKKRINGELDSTMGPGDKGKERKEKEIDGGLDSTTGPGDKGAPRKRKHQRKKTPNGVEEPGDKGGGKRKTRSETRNAEKLDSTTGPGDKGAPKKRKSESDKIRTRGGKNAKIYNLEIEGADGEMDREGEGATREPLEELNEEETGMAEEIDEGEDEELLDFCEKTQNKQIVVSDGTFSLIDESLFFSERSSSTLRLCIPESLVDEVLQLCHNARGHLGLRRTYSATALRFYFPKMSR
jgi:Integrase zinc binding domain